MKTKKILLLSAFSIMAVLFFLIENFIPKPFPFFRIGLSNVFILLVLWQLDFLSAMLITVTKVFLGSLFSGLIFTPVLLFSLFGGLFSITAMQLAIDSKIDFSIIGVSIIGAFTHNITQILIAYVLFIKNIKIFTLLPFLLILALISGLITGVIAYLINSKINLNILIENKL